MSKILAENSGGKFWRKIFLVENYGRKFWRKILTENSCRKFLRKILAENLGASQNSGGCPKFRRLQKIQAALLFRLG
jgi:hypothetical protein